VSYSVTLVKEVMSPGAVSLPPTASVREAAKLMKTKNIGSVMVIDEGRLVGIFTERDLVRLVAEGGDLDKPLAEVMTTNPVTVKPDDPLVLAVAKMVEHNIRHLPVIDEKGTPIGMLSVRDVIKHIL
jgi:CBS domain-containing protein